MTIAENNDMELYNELIEIGNLYLKGKKVSKVVVGNQIGIPQKDGTYKWIDGGPDLDPDLLAEAIRNTCRFIKDQGVKLANGVKAGNSVAVIVAAGGVITGTGGLVLLLEATFNVTELWENFKKFWENETNNTSNSTPGGSGGG